MEHANSIISMLLSADYTGSVSPPMRPYSDANQNMLPLAKDFALQVFEST